MPPNRPPLPNFENPPVVEVVLSLQFEPLPGLRASHFGMLWRRFKDQYPKTDDHGPLESVFEQFDPVPPTKVGIRIESPEKPPLPRVWFLSAKGDRLLQVQADRFIHNWQGEGAAYPRYEDLLNSFNTGFDTFREFAAQESLGDVLPNQCEVTYVNHLVSGQGWVSHGELAKLFRFHAAESPAQLGQLEDATMRLRFVMRDADQPIGRLHVEIQPVWRLSDRVAMYVMTLTARGAPMGVGLDGVQKFFATGRSWIVNRFASLTTREMHGIWRRTDV